MPVLGDEKAVLRALESTARRGCGQQQEYLGTDGMRSLAWQLEALDIDLVIAPAMADVASPRLQIHPVGGLPLLHVGRPQYRGAGRFGKLALDLAGSTLALLVLWPLLLVVAVLIKLDSRGPVLYKAERIGRNGEPFAMLKFRSMVVGAELGRLELLGRNDGCGPLFKLRDDPRITQVGRWIRRLSIDELPQLINVLRGEMSLVGPRPPLRAEVATYTETVHRRMLVKPGITGLWQVSGRSDLPGRGSQARPLLRRELVADPGLGDPVADFPPSVARHWCVLRVRLTRSFIAFFSVREVVHWDVRLAHAALNV